MTTELGGFLSGLPVEAQPWFERTAEELGRARRTLSGWTRVANAVEDALGEELRQLEAALLAMLEEVRSSASELPEEPPHTADLEVVEEVARATGRDGRRGRPSRGRRGHRDG